MFQWTRGNFIKDNSKDSFLISAYAILISVEVSLLLMDVNLFFQQRIREDYY